MIEDPQILAQLRLRIERKREPEVGLQAALVKLVEDHATRTPRAPGRAAASA